MIARDVTRILGIAATMAGALLSSPINAPLTSLASADACPDAEVVFARGSGQPAGLGDVGQAFVDALTEKVPGKSITVYPVNYPATHDYKNSALVGQRDATAHIESTVASCPGTKLVLGGYSQGASVIEMSSGSMPPQVANHVAAIALFGSPTSAYSSGMWGGPLPALAVAYRPKSIDFCIPDDIICAEGGNMIPHLMYVQNGLAEEGAAFAANRLASSARACWAAT